MGFGERRKRTPRAEFSRLLLDHFLSVALTHAGLVDRYSNCNEVPVSALVAAGACLVVVGLTAMESLPWARRRVAYGLPVPRLPIVR